MIFEPVYLKIINFMNHSFSEVDFEKFNSCIIIGRDKDNDRKSNGVGKSTIFHAISYVLFDQAPTKTLEKIVRDGQDSCEVEFQFLVDSEKHRIIRKRSNKSNKSEVILERFVDSWEKEDRRTKTDTEKAIKSILKINFESFNNSVLFSQNSFSALAEGTDAQKRAVLKEPLDLSVYSKYEKLSKKRLSNLETKFSNVEALLATLGDPEKDIKDSDVQLKACSEMIVDLQKQLEENKEKISKKKEENEKLNLLLTSDEAKVSDKLVQLTESKNKISTEISQSKEEFAKISSKITQISEKILKSNQEISEINSKVDLLKQSKFQSEEDINQKITELTERESRGNKYVSAIENDIEKYSKPLPKGSTCEVCFNELNDEYREKISETHSSILLSKQVDLEKSKLKLKNITECKNDFFKDLKDIAKNQAEISNLSSKILLLLNEISSNNDLEAKYREMKVALSEKVSTKETELSSIIESENILKTKVNDLSISDINNKIISNNSLVLQLVRNEKEIIEKISKFSSDIGFAKSRIETRTKDLESLNSKLLEKVLLKKELNLNSKVVKAFSSSGIPTLIIHTILDDLQTESNIVLQEIRPELNLKFLVQKEDKEVLDIHYFLNGKERDYQQLSGGQKTYISFALKLGLSIVIQKRMGVNFKFLELDEVDQALDEDGKDAFVEIVKKMHDKFKILLITHDSRMKARFNNCLLVENEGDNGSTVKLLNN